MNKKLIVLALLFSTFTLTNCSSTSSESAADSEVAACDATGITTFDYLIAFHGCPSDCGNPDNHTVFLAGSDDGADWTIIDSFESFEGSVPELVYADQRLFIHTPNEVRSYNACFQALSSEEVSLTSDTDSGGYVDPSLIVEDDEVILFYLPGVLGGDPASCSSYPCTKEIHSASSADETQTAFTQITGNRAQVDLAAGAASDPDIIATTEGTYLLYVSNGQNVLVFTGTSLTDEFISPDGATDRMISNSSGGVPTAIQAPNGDIWLYVTTNQSGTEVVRRAISSDGITELDDSAFTTVLDASINPSLDSTVSLSSPSIIAWPGSDWTTEETTLTAE